MSTEKVSMYWVGPYGILVPNHITYVKAEDGSNRHYSHGAITEKNITKPITESMYKDKYAIFDAETNSWYHIDDNIPAGF